MDYSPINLLVFRLEGTTLVLVEGDECDDVITVPVLVEPELMPRAA